MMNFLKNLFNQNGWQPRSHSIAYPQYGHDSPDKLKPKSVHKNVLMITHNPILKTQGGLTLKEYFNWNDPEMLAKAYVQDVYWASYGYANYRIVEHIEVDGYPIKRDGFRYDEESYLAAWKTRQFHDPDGVDYHALVNDFRLIERVNADEIDEVWLFGHPYGGYYESIMCGQDAFWCNAPPLDKTDHAKKLFVIMGFNFERGVGEMLEDLGHRAESMLFELYKDLDGSADIWERFLRIEQENPNKAEVGSVHFAPNSVKDYDWGNQSPVLSRADTWYNFPDLSGNGRTMDCRDWGNGDIRLHHLWWFRHMPHIVGEQNGISNNRWQYIIDPSLVRKYQT
jgi:hypothetical protein